MDKLRLSKAPKSAKFLVTSLFCIIGLTYILLLMHIYIDSEMKPSLIIEAYGEMEYIELTDIAKTYMPFYGLFLFAPPVILFMFTSFSEKWKKFYAIFPFVWVIIDIASMWLTPYLWTGFAYVLWGAGTVLGMTFFSLFLLIMYDLWLRKVKE